MEKPSEEEDPVPWLSSNDLPPKKVQRPLESAGKPMNIPEMGRHVMLFVLSITVVLR